MPTTEPLETLKVPYMVRNPMKWGFLWLKGVYLYGKGKCQPWRAREKEKGGNSGENIEEYL